MEKLEKNSGVSKSNINWLACIYGDHHLSPIKWEFLRNEILQVLLKKKEK